MTAIDKAWGLWTPTPANPDDKASDLARRLRAMVRADMRLIRLLDELETNLLPARASSAARIPIWPWHQPAADQG